MTPNGFFMILKSESHYWTLTLRTLSEHNYVLSKKGERHRSSFALRQPDVFYSQIRYSLPCSPHEEVGRQLLSPHPSLGIYPPVSNDEKQIVYSKSGKICFQINSSKMLPQCNRAPVGCHCHFYFSIVEGFVSWTFLYLRDIHTLVTQHQPQWIRVS